MTQAVSFMGSRTAVEDQSPDSNARDTIPRCMKAKARTIRMRLLESSVNASLTTFFATLLLLDSDINQMELVRSAAILAVVVFLVSCQRVVDTS